jgi:L-fucose mutarotase
MLRNIPGIISPDLMRAMMMMGHGDEIVFADADFPVPAAARTVIRMDGVRTGPLLEAVLPFFPLDHFVEKPVITMDCSEWGPEPESYRRYREVLGKHDPKFKDFELLKRFDLYRRAVGAFAVVVTGEPDGNLILKKGPAAA